VDWDQDGFLTRRAKDYVAFEKTVRFCGMARLLSSVAFATVFSKIRVRQLIVERERVCKPKKARLTHRNISRLGIASSQIPDTLPFRFPLHIGALL